MVRKSYIYETILEGYKAQEIAEAQKCSQLEAACIWIDAVANETPYNVQAMPKYRRYETTTKAGIDVYYDYGADYYFFVLR